MRLLLILGCIALHQLNAYNIFVYNPKFGHSHSNYMGRIADILAEEGHNVTSLIPVMSDGIKDGTTKSTVIHVHPPPTAENINPQVNFFEKNIMDPIDTWKRGHDFGLMFAEMCNITINTEGLLEKLRNEHFDVFITENFDMCGIGLYMSSMNVHSIMDRARNIFAELLIRVLFGQGTSLVEGVFRANYGEDFPSMEALTSYCAYFFTNAEPLIDFARPIVHRVIDIGGIGPKKPVPLSKEWKDILARRPKTVLWSFGSVARTYELSIESKMSILQAMKNIPDVTFIWKYEIDDEFTAGPAKEVTNLVLSKWVPQNDLLNDPRLAVFVSHGGMGSVQETALRGVPALFVPLFGDQPRNSLMLAHNGAALFELTDSDGLTAAIRELITNESYKKNAAAISHKLQSKPFNARELLVRHVEFAAEFGPSPSLRPQSHDMTLVEYFNLDIIAVVVTVAIAFVVICIRLFLCICCRIKKVKTE